MAPTLVILALMVIGMMIYTSVWTDVLWYRQLGFLRVLGTELIAKLVLFLVGTLVMGLSVFLSLVIAHRARPVYSPVSPEQASLERYREGLEPVRRLITVAVPLVIGLFAGSAAAQHWQTAMLYPRPARRLRGARMPRGRGTRPAQQPALPAAGSVQQEPPAAPRSQWEAGRRWRALGPAEQPAG